MSIFYHSCLTYVMFMLYVGWEVSTIVSVVFLDVLKS